MNKERLVLRVILLALAVALVYVGGQWASAESDTNGLEYKVVSADNIFTREAYEQLLNEMADQGWVVDHVIPGEYTVVFRR